MRVSVLLIATSVIYGFYGLAFMLYPTEVIDQFGGHMDSIGAFTTQLFGSMLIGTATICWFARNASHGTAFTAIITGMLVGCGMVSVFAIINQVVSPTAKNWALLLIAIQVLLTAGFGYAWIGLRRAAKSS